MNFEEQILAMRAAGHDVWCAGGCSDDLVASLESALNVLLPPSYRQFLLTLGAVDISGSPVSGIIDGNPLDPSGGSLYGETQRMRLECQLPEPLLVLQSDEDALYCFDTSVDGLNGEYPVVCFELASRHCQVIAVTFSEWLQTFIFQ